MGFWTSETKEKWRGTKGGEGKGVMRFEPGAEAKALCAAWDGHRAGQPTNWRIPSQGFFSDTSFCSSPFLPLDLHKMEVRERNQNKVEQRLGN